MIDRKDTNSTVNTVIDDLSNDDTPLVLSDGPFQLAIRIQGIYNGQAYNFWQDDSLFSMSIVQKFNNNELGSSTSVQHSYSL